MSAPHIENFEKLIHVAAYDAGISTIPSHAEALARPVVVHCQDATYPITDVHLMPDGSIGIEVALHETEEPCNCDQTR